MKKYASILAGMILVVFLSTIVRAQIGFDINSTDRAEFARHRKALYNVINDNVAILFGSFIRSDTLRWRQDNRFYYLTGVEIPFAILIMDGRQDHTVLFLEQGSTPVEETWTGKRIGPGPEAVALFGINDIRPIAGFESSLRGLISSGDKVYLPLLPEENIAGVNEIATEADKQANKYSWSRDISREQRIKNWLEGMTSGITVEDICPLLDNLRRIKTSWEIDRITEACNIADSAFQAAMVATGSGVMEYEIEAVALSEFIANGALFPGYHATVASGANATILRYGLASKKIRKKELILMDFGPDYRYYTASVTRTWPVSGKFSKKTTVVYQDCLEIHEELIDAVKPGVTIGKMKNTMKKLFRKKGYKNNILHGPARYIGMSSHDIGSEKKALETDCVIAVETGIYFQDQGWGVRIEDVVQVTNKGSKVLSNMIPVEIEKIERIMGVR